MRGEGESLEGMSDGVGLSLSTNPSSHSPHTLTSQRLTSQDQLQLDFSVVKSDSNTITSLEIVSSTRSISRTAEHCTRPACGQPLKANEPPGDFARLQDV